MKVLHIGGAGAIMNRFVEFINQHFDPQDHVFLMATPSGYEMPGVSNFLNLSQCSKIKSYWRQISGMHKAEKVVIHGLFDPRIILLLVIFPWVSRKCYWAIWGGDLYDHQYRKKNWKWKIKIQLKKTVIPKIGHFITHIKGDYDLARQWYGAKGKWHDCFMYPSNLFKDYQLTPRLHEGINILLGNSATPSNNHMSALERLRPFADRSVKIYCPLSYGDGAYADEVEQAGRNIFGNKFIALRKFLPFENYLELLSSIDVAIFNHDRQQAVGNIVSLLGLGKKVYIRSDITTWGFMSAIGAVIFDVKNLNDLGGVLDGGWSKKNMDLVKNYFSKENLIEGWQSIFGDKNALFES